MKFLSFFTIVLFTLFIELLIFKPQLVQAKLLDNYKVPINLPVVEWESNQFNIDYEVNTHLNSPQIITTNFNASRALFVCSNVTEIHQSECQTLVAFYTSTNGTSWTNNTGWLQTNQPCSWYGVSCTAGHITQIVLENNNLTGSLVNELGNLTDLQYLVLPSNTLTGTIPIQIADLSNLLQLNLSNNGQMNGSIPPKLGNLNKLLQLNLENNKFSGPIPIELSNLTSLRYLNLSQNKLSGGIPPEIGRLTNLLQLNLWSNPLKGSIPVELGQLTKLQYLDLDATQITGTIPSQIGILINLNMLAIANNQLSGNVPTELTNLSNLNSLNIGGNLLVGSLPLSLTNLGKLNSFVFDRTNLCEPNEEIFQTWLKKLRFLRRTNIICSPLLSIDKTVDKVIVQTGNTVNYNLSLTSIDITQTIYLTDTLPTGLNVVTSSLSNGLIYDATTHQLHYNSKVNGVLTLTYQAKVDSKLANGSVLYNEVEVTTLSGQTMQWRGAGVVVVVPDPTFQETLALFYLGVDNNLDKAGTEAIIRLRRSCQANHYVKCWVVVDWKGMNNAYLYQFDDGLSIPTNAICPNPFNVDCNGKLLLGQTMWSWGENSPNPFGLAQAIIAMTQAYPNAVNTDQLIVTLIGHGGGFSNEMLLAGQPQKDSGQPQKDGGQTGGLFYDENPLGVMSVADLRQALTIARQQTNYAVGLLYLDMCLMSNLEVLHELNGLADYVLASPNWAFAAFPYDKHIEVIDGQKDVKAIGQAWLNNQVTRLTQDQYPHTFSLIDMTKVPSLVIATERLAKALLPQSQTIDGRAKLRQARLNSQCFDSDENGTINSLDYYCDLGSFVEQLLSQFMGDTTVHAAAESLMNRLSQTVILEKHNRQRFANPYPWYWNDTMKGISLFTPLVTPTWQLQYYNDYELKFAEDTSWDTVLNNYWQDTITPTLPTGCEANCTFPPIVQSLPTLLIPNLFASPNSTATIPINIINLSHNCLASVNIAVQYDPTIATFITTTATANLVGGTFSVNSSESGVLHIAAIMANCQPFAGSGTLFNLTFQINGTVGQTTTLNFVQGISQTAIYDQNDLVNSLNLNLNHGLLTLAQSYIRGDVNGDKTVNSVDALMALQQAVGKANLDLTQQNACDVNGDTRCTVADVPLILCYASQQNWSVCQQTSSLRRYLTSTAVETPTLCLSPVTKNGQQTLALKVIGAPDLAGTELTLNYDPSQMTISQLTKGSLTQNFYLDSHEVVSGELKIALAYNNPINTDGILLQFAVTAQVPTATLTLSEVRLNNRAGQDFETNLVRTIEVATCRDTSNTYLPIVIKR